MTIPFDLLPTELQASVVELRQSGVPESTIATMVDRMLGALAVKANRVQVEVWEMEERLGTQLTQIGNKLQSDIQTQLGATNEMLTEVRSAQQHAHPRIEEARQGIAELKKNWSELDDWRSRVEAALLSFSESRDESKAERKAIRDEIKQLNARHGKQITALNERLAAIEQLLEIAGQHDEAGG